MGLHVIVLNYFVNYPNKAGNMQFGIITQPIFAEKETATNVVLDTSNPCLVQVQILLKKPVSKVYCFLNIFELIRPKENHETVHKRDLCIKVSVWENIYFTTPREVKKIVGSLLIHKQLEKGWSENIF